MATNWSNGGVAIRSGTANGQNAGGPINGTNAGVAVGQGSTANNGGVALRGGTTSPGCTIAIGSKCF